MSLEGLTREELYTKLGSYIDELSGIARKQAARIEELETNCALYKEDVARIWALMPELRNTDAHYEVHEAVHQKIGDLERKLEEFQTSRRKEAPEFSI